MINPSQNELIGIRFVGGGITPRNVPASDLADLLKAAETLVTSTVLREHGKLTKEDLILGLTRVEDQSLGLTFTSSIPQIVVPEFQRITKIISQHLFDSLPPEARDALRKIATFTRKNRCVAEFRIGTDEAVLATVDAELFIPAASRLYIRTTLYGRVVNAGGKNPNAHIETIQGTMVICRGSLAQVKQLAERLYTNVGIVGNARCDVETLEIEDVEITEILPYEEVPIADAINELAKLAGYHFAGIDADEYVKALREGESEE